jgi:hypothetical protein
MDVLLGMGVLLGLGVLLGTSVALGVGGSAVAVALGGGVLVITTTTTTEVGGDAAGALQALNSNVPSTTPQSRFFISQYPSISQRLLLTQVLFLR